MDGGRVGRIGGLAFPVHTDYPVRTALALLECSASDIGIQTSASHTAVLAGPQRLNPQQPFDGAQTPFHGVFCTKRCFGSRCRTYPPPVFGLLYFSGVHRCFAAILRSAFGSPHKCASSGRPKCSPDRTRSSSLYL